LKQHCATRFAAGHRPGRFAAGRQR